MSDKIYTFEELSAVVRSLLRKYGAESAILFGSYARQEATPSSDIDLIVRGSAAFDPTDVFSIADELHRITQKNVDVYEMREINPGSPFHRAIIKEGIRIA